MDDSIAGMLLPKEEPSVERRLSLLEDRVHSLEDTVSELAQSLAKSTEKLLEVARVFQRTIELLEDGECPGTFPVYQPKEDD